MGDEIRDRVDALERELAQLREVSGARPRWRVRSVVAAAVVLSIGISGVAVGVTGTPLLEGARNPATGAASQQTSFVSNNAAGYTASMQNVNGSDGGALAGTCKAAMDKEGCVAGANLGAGRAFDFFAGGSEAGRISVANPASRPFTTNATGVATGLNADKVDGKDASELSGVLGYGATKECLAPSNCPLLRNKNVTSVRQNEIFGTLCIKVAGGDPSTHTIIAGLNGFYGASAAVNTQNYAAGDSNAFRCEADEFQVEPSDKNLRVWFVVLR